MFVSSRSVAEGESGTAWGVPQAVPLAVTVVALLGAQEQ
jgi:hypothetical protein